MQMNYETKPCPRCGKRSGQASARMGGIERKVVTWWHCPTCNHSFDRQEFSEKVPTS